MTNLSADETSISSSPLMPATWVRLLHQRRGLRRSKSDDLMTIRTPLIQSRPPRTTGRRSCTDRSSAYLALDCGSATAHGHGIPIPPTQPVQSSGFGYSPGITKVRHDADRQCGSRDEVGAGRVVHAERRRWPGQPGEREVPVEVVASTRALIQTSLAQIIADAGSTNVDLTQYTTNPFPGTPITIQRATVEVGEGGTAGPAGDGPGSPRAASVTWATSTGSLDKTPTSRVSRPHAVTVRDRMRHPKKRHRSRE